MAGPRTESNGQIVKRDREPEVIVLLGKMKSEIARALPRHITPDRMMRVALTALRQTPRLLDCSTATVLGSIMSSAQLGLEPNTPLGMSYLVPYGKNCQLIIGYQGYLDLARRSKLVSMPQAMVVRHGDLYEVTYGTNPTITHEPSDDPDRENQPITHVYAYAHQLPMGSAPPTLVSLTRAQVMARKARSASVKAGRTSPWDTDEEAMFQKTGIRALWKWLPKNIEMATASTFDDHADRGVAQAESWSQDFVDAMKREGVVVDSDGVVVDSDPDAKPEPSEPGSEG